MTGPRPALERSTMFDKFLWFLYYIGFAFCLGLIAWLVAANIPHHH